MAFDTEYKKRIVKEQMESGLSHRAWYALEDRPFAQRSFDRWAPKYRDEIQYDLPPGEQFSGASRLKTWRDEDGNYMAEWTKSSKELEDQKALIKSFADGFLEDMPRAEPVAAPKRAREDILAQYTLTDAHIGMRGDEWDLEIAEKMICGWIDMAVRSGPDAHTAVFNVQGDTSHWDSLKPVTPASQHVLDAACGSREMARMVIKLMRYCIKVLLETHQEVHVKYLVGNHDEYTAVLNSEWLNVFYEDEPRLTVDVTDAIYHCFEWGNVGLYYHHGHKRNMNTVDKVFARMFREVYGRTTKAYGHLGHFHHKIKVPTDLMTIEVHPTLAGKDEYAKFGGYISDRESTTIYYSKNGEIGRNTITPEMIL